MPTVNNLELLARQTCQAVRETAVFIRGEMGKVSADQVEEKFLNGLVSYVALTAEEMLVARLPRFVWRATLTANGTPIMEVLFDATGMARSFPGLDVLYHDQAFRKETRQGVALPGVAALLGEELTAFLREKT